jgi:hypothetical protein
VDDLYDNPWQPVHGFNVADFSPFYEGEPPLDGHHVYKVRVTDPRQTAPNDVRLEGHSLPLTRVGADRETQPFAVYTDSHGNAANGAYPLVRIPVGDVLVEYNPPRRWKSKLTMRTGGFWDEFGGAMQRHTDDMEIDMSWVNRPEYQKIPQMPNRDAMLQGLELHRRMASLDTGAADCRWMADVYVRMSTRKVVHIGPNPPDALLGTADVQQIDMVRLNDDVARFAVGANWDNNNIQLLIDIKASTSGRLKGDQEDRLMQLAGDPNKLATCRPYRLYRNGLWDYNQQWGLNWRTYTLMGLAITAAGNAAQLVIQGMADDLDALSSHANDVMQRMKPRACYALSVQFASRASMTIANAARCIPRSVDASRS